MRSSQVNGNCIIKFYALAAFWLLAFQAYAVDIAGLDVGKIVGEGWKLEGARLIVSELNQQKPRFLLSATKLGLPQPFHDLTLANIQCNDFTWDHDELNCKQGRASVRSAYWQSPVTRFSFHLSPNVSQFRLDDARLAGSQLVLDVSIDKAGWHCKVNAKHISNTLIDKLFQASTPKTQQKQKRQGYLNLVGTFSGKNDQLFGFNFSAEVEGLTDQAQDGKVATEKLHLVTQMVGKKTGNKWRWQSKSKLLGGALYVEPLYLEVKETNAQPIVLDAQGFWNANTKQAEVQSYVYTHPDIGRLTGSAKGFYKDKLVIESADVNLQSNTLPALLTTYINPFFAEPFTNVSVTGEVQANFSVSQQTLTDASVRFSKLNLNDEAGHLAINEGRGLINWSDNPALTKRSELAWQKLLVKGLPLQAARLQLTSRGNQIRLDEKVKLPFLNGSIAIDKFSWQAKKQDDPEVSFAGSVDNVSLEQLSKALGWTPLLGSISGKIPGIEYHDKTLSLDSELRVNVFDGLIKVNNLISSGLFTDYPKLLGDVEVVNLDLDQLTRKFEFGNITGRVSGFIKDLVLENWKPVTFYAWLGTPEDDDSSHRISQKAVNNIASIGGGGATDLLSRSFLGFFETFGYDKIGVGCYLHDGVCQMMGLEATGQGYYLIKGGGLPRIDVLGYNARINWDVLVERLSRVASPDKAIIH